MVVKIAPNEKGTPPGKLAEAELHFDDGCMSGLKLVGFAVWERRNGTDTTAQDRVRDLILQAYQEHEERGAVAD